MTLTYKGCVILTPAERDELPTMNWEIQTRSWNMSGPPFTVWHTTDEHFQYFKPHDLVHKVEFEMLFNFKMGGSDFEIDRIVKYAK